MTSGIDNYRIVLEPIRKVVFVKCLTTDEDTELFNKIATGISKKTKQFSIKSYQHKLLTELVVDYSELLSILTPDEEPVVVSSLYNAVTQLYPHFKLEHVCLNLNLLNHIRARVSTLNQLHL